MIFSCDRCISKGGCNCRTCDNDKPVSQCLLEPKLNRPLNCYQFIIKKKQSYFSTTKTYCEAVTCDFQQCDILTSVDSDEPVQLLVKLRNSK